VDVIERTTVHETLQGLGGEAGLPCGTVTQGSASRTAPSLRADERCQVTILTFAGTAVNSMGDT
jgi:hypothetical protein